jgi:hypothetical protein
MSFLGLVPDTYPQPTTTSTTPTQTPSAGSSGGGTTGGGTTGGGGTTTGGGGWSAPASFGTWTLQYYENFPSTIGEGSMFNTSGVGQSPYNEWRCYPASALTTDKQNHYATNNMSVVSSIAGAVSGPNVMQFRIFKGSDGKLACCAPYPLAFSGNTTQYQTYGRYESRFKTNAQVSGVHIAHLLWPQTDDNKTKVWPGGGETDYPEGNSNGTIGAFMHWYNGTSGGSQDPYSTSQHFDSWHTYVIEWKPSSCEFFLDGASIGHSTGSHVVPNPMRWIAQTESASTTTISGAGTFYLYMDYVAMWSYTP